MQWQKITAIVGAVVLALGGIIGIIYVTDTPIQASVIDTDCSALGQDFVTIKTKLPIPGITRKLEVDGSACSSMAALRADGEDPFVKYYPKSERTIIYDRDPDNGGTVIYDTK